jgi:ribosomal protein L32
MADTTCPNCGRQVPEGDWCVRCGASLAGGEAPERRAGSFAAAPNERAWSPRVVSTLFPQLPRADMWTFRLALGAGIAIVVALAALRLFPVAAVTAALLVPLLTLVYLYDVDVYEDEPLRVILLTLGWGALTGVGVGLLAEAVTESGAQVLAGDEPDTLVIGVLLPLLGVVLMLAGPLVLLPYRRFNDVLDGATFGAVSAAAFVSAEALVFAWSLFDAGLRPDGEIAPWMARVVNMAVALPVLAMAAIGAAAAALWLRYRAPVRDRAALGPLGNPLLALPLAAALFVAGSVGQPLLPVGWWLVELLVLDTLALLWLRQVIHLGLMQEAAEIEIGPAIECPNCGAQTARHTFCSNCGVALRALPKSGPVEPPPTGAPAEAGA